MSLLFFILLILQPLEAADMEFCTDADATPYLYFEDSKPKTAVDSLYKPAIIDGRRVLISIPLDFDKLHKNPLKLNLFIDCKYRSTEHFESDY